MHAMCMHGFILLFFNDRVTLKEMYFNEGLLNACTTSVYGDSFETCNSFV